MSYTAARSARSAPGQGSAERCLIDLDCVEVASSITQPSHRRQSRHVHPLLIVESYPYNITSNVHGYATTSTNNDDVESLTAGAVFHLSFPPPPTSPAKAASLGSAPPQRIVLTDAVVEICESCIQPTSRWWKDLVVAPHLGFSLTNTPTRIWMITQLSVRQRHRSQTYTVRERRGRRLFRPVVHLASRAKPMLYCKRDLHPM